MIKDNSGVMMQKKEFSLKEIATLTGSTLAGDPNKLISHVADLESASEDDASFLANVRYTTAMETSKAGVIFVSGEIPLHENKNFLISENPSRSFQTLVELFFEKEQKITGFEGIHPTAVVHETVTLGKNVSIGPQAVIDEHTFIGENTRIGAGCYIGPRNTIGSDCLLHPRVTIRENCIMGNRVVIQPGAVIGSCGFGFTTDKSGKHSRLMQLGNVVLGDDVEIGANTVIDRSRFKSTKISSGTKIDNLVQIAHGVIIGEHNIIVAQTGIAGSTETGKYVVIGGQVGINGHIKICDGAMIAAKSGVTKSIKAPGKYSGYTAIPIKEFNRHHILSLRIETYVNQIKELNKRLTALEQGPLL